MLVSSIPDHYITQTRNFVLKLIFVTNQNAYLKTPIALLSVSNAMLKFLWIQVNFNSNCAFFIARISRQQSGSNCRMYMDFYSSLLECPELGTDRIIGYIGRQRLGISCKASQELECVLSLLERELLRLLHRPLEQEEGWFDLPQDANMDVQVIDHLSRGSWCHTGAVWHVVKSLLLICGTTGGAWS